MVKQETLEEAAEKYCLINNIPIDQMIVKTDRSCEFETPITMFIEGAKWQQEKDKNKYSEEDMLNFALFLEVHLPMKPRKTHRQLLEQFKKK